MCIVLAALLSVFCFGMTAFAASEAPSVAELQQDTAEEDGAVQASLEEEGTDAYEAAYQPDEDAISGEDADGREVGSGLPEGASAYLPDAPDSTHSPQEIYCTTIGAGTVYALVDGEREELGSWVETVEFPVEDAVFAAVPESSGEDVTGVTVDGRHVDFEEDNGIWVFTVDRLQEDTQIIVSFGDAIPGSVDILGPGRVSLLEEDEWVPVSEEEPEFEGEAGTVLRLLAVPTQTGYAATSVTVGDAAVEPVMYSAQGPVFEITVAGPVMDITVRFLASDELDMEIAGEGTVEISVADTWVQIENGAKIPFDPEEVTADDPMVFRAVPAQGYAMSDVRYASYPVIVTKMDSPADQPDLEQYMFSIADPRDDALLHVTFLASSDSAVEWLRGSDTTTGISWAVPLGTSSYGVSNVTQGSNVLTTLLTQGTAYEQARTLAARFGSVFTAWDFSLVNADGASYRPTVPILFSIPIPSGYPASTQSLRMLHILSDGQMTENPIEIRTDAATGRQYIYMRTESLSTFILVNTASGSGVATPVPTYAPTAVPTAAVAAAAGPTASGTAPGTADTRDLAAWILVALTAFAAAVYAGARYIGRARTGGR